MYTHFSYFFILYIIHIHLKKKKSHGENFIKFQLHKCSALFLKTFVQPCLLPYYALLKGYALVFKLLRLEITRLNSSSLHSSGIEICKWH